MTDDVLDAMRVLIAKDRIASVLVQYCRAADRRDLAALKAVYWPEATDNHGLYQGGAHQFCELNVHLAQTMVHMTQHVIGNIDCRIDGNRARVESTVLAYHRVLGDADTLRTLLGTAYAAQHDAAAGHHDFLVGGQYFDRFECRDGVWKIIDRVASADWAIAQPAGTTWRDGALKSAADLGVDLTSARNPGP